jgi:hypothetical protein
MIRRALDEFVVGEMKRAWRRTQQKKLNPQWVAAGFAPFALIRGELVGNGIRMRGTVLHEYSSKSRVMQVRIFPRNLFRKHATDPHSAPWCRVGAERWVILEAADNGLIMVREEIGNTSVLLSIMAAVPVDRSRFGRPCAFRPEIVEVQGEVEKDI